MHSRMRSVVLFVVGLTLILSVAALCARNVNPGVLPADGLAYGKTYGDWGAAWWQWALSFPVGADPITDATGEYNMQRQSGPVWFLGGTWIGPVVRTVQIPFGKAIFFGIANYLTYPYDGFQPAPGQSMEEFLTNDAMTYIDTNVPTEDLLSAEVDGRSLLNLFAYRGTSRMFWFVTDPSWDLGPGWTPPGVSDGYWIMLAPLRRGQHIIHFECAPFGQNVTYCITVP